MLEACSAAWSSSLVREAPVVQSPDDAAVVVAVGRGAVTSVGPVARGAVAGVCGGGCIGTSTSMGFLLADKVRLVAHFG